MLAFKSPGFPECLFWEVNQNILEEMAFHHPAGSHFSSPASYDNMGTQTL